MYHLALYFSDKIIYSNTHRLSPHIDCAQFCNGIKASIKAFSQRDLYKEE